MKINQENFKFFFVDLKLVENLQLLNNKKLLPTVSRNSVIAMKFVGLKVYVHNGKDFSEILILKEMVGHKFGEFSPTREKFTFKKKKKK